MDNLGWHLVVCGTLLIGFMYYFSNRTIANVSELNTCPFCYGEDYCCEFQNNVSLQYRTLADVMFNLFSIKNVYFASNGGTNVVIKKLAHDDDFRQLNQFTLNRLEKIITTQDVLELISEKYKKFQVCDLPTARLFVQKFDHKHLTHLWTLLHVNVEPLLLETFRKDDNWPVPRLFGYCGRTAIVEDCGIPLNDIESLDWFSRAYVAIQLLNSSDQFTFGHPEFRLYLTDISPDNIAVDPKKLKMSFIDLEHCILQKKTIEATYHYTEHISGEEYGFSTNEICGSSISDHNVYAVCRLLLSPSSPWPMMHNGLLHSPPAELDTTSLYEQIDLCVYSPNRTSRFLHSVQIRELLSDILKNVNYFIPNLDGV